MSQPLIMSFRPDAAEMCLDGRKTMTRRIKGNDCLIVRDDGGRITSISRYQTKSGRYIKLWKVGESIAIKPKRHLCAMGRVMCTGLKVEHVQDITEEDAIREGMEMRRWDGRSPYNRDADGLTVGWSSRWHELGNLSRWAIGGSRKEPMPLTEDDICLGSAWGAFINTWKSLYPKGPKSWEANPLVVAIEFRPLEDGEV